MATKLLQQKENLQKFFQLLVDNNSVLAALTTGRLSDAHINYVKIATEKAKLSLKPPELDAFLCLISRHKDCAPAALLAAHSLFTRKRKSGTNASRVNKRELKRALGLGEEPRSYSQLGAQGVKIVSRDRVIDHEYKCRTTLVDRGNEDLVRPGDDFLSVPVDDGTWYVVEPDESVVFVNSNGEVELSGIRNCCTQRPDLVDYTNSIIYDAVGMRKNVRNLHWQPNHGGSLVQYGWNAGARHLRVFGLVNNITNRNISSNAHKEKDQSLLGIFALSWNLLVASLPREVVNLTKGAIADAGLPFM
ncbi:hypothetical protein BJ138DRAFT_1107542 [Hygrophoropsis aurantiaca]|uniref:Uncharacterized protein n=1 Tax=Hygrophoropsis aurantiaca TaxID=72124 RepID=A0ACB7ZQZ8_9AGAM|nr:hypothetical protein BJ138DRAFT_1107542 [Hygrophoropsis aurantiaca]